MNQIQQKEVKIICGGIKEITLRQTQLRLLFSVDVVGLLKSMV